jgi:hypothetical protein
MCSTTYKRDGTQVKDDCRSCACALSSNAGNHSPVTHTVQGKEITICSECSTPL